MRSGTAGNSLFIFLWGVFQSRSLLSTEDLRLNIEHTDYRRTEKEYLFETAIYDVLCNRSTFTTHPCLEIIRKAKRKRER